jgi:hypothetical protein
MLAASEIAVSESRGGVRADCFRPLQVMKGVDRSGKSKRDLNAISGYRENGETLCLCDSLRGGEKEHSVYHSLLSPW